MILAGVDEAGLGPTIGPLVTAAAALRTPDSWRPDTPWEELSEAVARERRRGDARPVVADSKKLYAAGGMAALELTLAAFAVASGGTFVQSATGGGDRHPCYCRGPRLFPAHTDPARVSAVAGELGRALAVTGAAIVHLEASALYEPDLNRRFAEGLNKNQALLRETGDRLAALAEGFPDEPLRVTVDKQGGRNDYLPFLTGLFPGAWVEELAVGAATSRYRVRRPGGALEVCFSAKADRDSFATALASIAAKYVRERAMAELNAWFCRLAPDLAPTAGYPLDARRWLAEAGAMCGAEAGVEKVVRER